MQVKVRGAAKDGKGAEARAKKRNQKLQQSSALDSKREKLDKEKVRENMSRHLYASRRSQFLIPLCTGGRLYEALLLSPGPN